MLTGPIWDSPTDTYVSQQAVVSSTSDSKPNRTFSVFTNASAPFGGPLLSGPTSRLWQYLFWSDIGGNNTYATTDNNGRNVFGSAAQINSTPPFFLRRWDLMFRSAAASNEIIYSGPVGCRNLSVGYPINVAGAPRDWELNIWTPFQWQDLDAAEVIHTVVRYYAGLGSLVDTYLDKQSFLDLSEAMQDPYLRVAFDFVAEPGTTWASMVNTAALKGGGILLWGAAPTGIYEAKMSLRLSSSLDLNTEVFKVRQLGQDNTDRNTILAALPTARRAAELLFNRIDSRWGHFVGTTDLGFPTQLYEAGSLGSKIDTVQDRAPGSITENGEFSVKAEPSRAIPMSDYANNAANCEQWYNAVREFSYAFGPEHFDFIAGDLVQIQDEARGLDGSETLLAHEKTYDWDSLTAAILAVNYEQKRPSPTSALDLEPKVGIIDFDLWALHESDQGLSFDGTTKKVIQWNDLSGNNHHLAPFSGAGTGGRADAPLVIQGQPDFNGEDYLDFNGAQLGASSNWRGLQWTMPPIPGTKTDYGMLYEQGYLIMACVLFWDYPNPADPNEYAILWEFEDQDDGDQIGSILDTDSSLAATRRTPSSNPPYPNDASRHPLDGGALSGVLASQRPTILVHRWEGQNSRNSVFKNGTSGESQQDGWATAPDSGKGPLHYAGHDASLVFGGILRADAALGTSTTGFRNGAGTSDRPVSPDGAVAAVAYFQGHPTPSQVRRVAQRWAAKYGAVGWGLA